MAIVQLDPAASRDIRKLFRDQPTLVRLRQALRALEAETPNLDIKTLSGRSPWHRLRVGDWRILFRPFTPTETQHHGSGYLVARIVNRRDLERAVRTL